MKKNHILFWIPMIYNGFCLLISLIVGITFLIGSQMPVTAEVQLPDIIVVCFTIFDVLMMISPLMLVVMVVISIFNLIRENTKTRRFLPLVFSTIMQGLLSAFCLSALTQPAG